MPPRTTQKYYFVAFDIVNGSLWLKYVRIVWTAYISGFCAVRPAGLLPSGSGCCWMAPGAGDIQGQGEPGVSPSTTEIRKKPPSPLQNPAKIKKAIFNFIKAPYGRYFTNFILVALLTIKYIWCILKAHRRCFKCKSIKRFAAL